jgi:hypothetical protein
MNIFLNEDTNFTSSGLQTTQQSAGNTPETLLLGSFILIERIYIKLKSFHS